MPVALVQMARLGDLAQAWPLTAALRSFSQVTLVVNSGLAPLARMMADDVLSINLKNIINHDTDSNVPSSSLRNLSTLHHRLREVAADTVVNLNFHPAVAAIAETIPASRRLGHRWIDVVTGRPSDPITEELFRASSGSRAEGRALVDVWLRYSGILLSGLPTLKPSGSATARADTLLAASGISPEQPIIAMIVGAGLAGRILPPETWGVAARAAARFGRVVLIGTAAESLIGQAVSQISGAIDLTGKTDLESLTGLLERANLVTGVDTGALHLAAALGTPTVGIYYGSMGFRQTGPYGNDHIILAPSTPGYPLSESAMRFFPASGLPSAEAVTGLISARLSGSTLSPPAGWSIWSSKLGDSGIEWRTA